MKKLLTLAAIIEAAMGSGLLRGHAIALKSYSHRSIDLTDFLVQQ